jgi:hypothetical protein
MKKVKKSAVEQAFERSDKHSLGDLPLQPWTADRVIAAQSMGMIWPNVGKEGFDQYDRTKTYPGALRDAIIVLWLCTLSDEQVEEADRAPNGALIRAKKWAAERGIPKINSDAYDAAFGKFIDIVSEVKQSATTPAETEEEDDDPNE